MLTGIYDHHGGESSRIHSGASDVTNQSYGYDCQLLHDLILLLFGKYAIILERQYEKTFDEVYFGVSYECNLSDTLR